VHVENGSKFTRGKKAVRERITWMLLTSYQGQELNQAVSKRKNPNSGGNNQPIIS
jgi:hypothetical protein